MGRVSSRVPLSLGEPMLECNIGWSRRGVPSGRIKYVRRYDDIILERFGPTPMEATALAVGQSATDDALSCHNCVSPLIF